MKPRPSTRQHKIATGAPPAVVPELFPAWTVVVAALGLAAAVFAIYSPALEFQFVLDDHRFTGDPRIQSSGHIWDYFANYVWAQFTGGPSSFYRPLFILWLRINFILSAMSPWGWHLLSIAKHVAVAVLLGLLVKRLLSDRVAGLLAGTLFALHPAQAESAAWVTVPDPLMSIAILVAVLLYLKYAASLRGSRVEEQKSRKVERAKQNAQAGTWWLVASAVAYFAALLAKETAVVFPLVIFALALLIPSPDAGWRVRLARGFRQTAPFLCATVLYLLLRFHALGGKLGSLTQHFPWTTVVMSAPATLWFYVKVLLWPARSYSFADPTLVEAFSFWGVLLPGAGIAAVVAVLAGAVFWAQRKARRDLPTHEAVQIEFALIIGTLLLILPILPALHLNALNPGDFLHGRYTYLPSAGLMLLLAAGWHLAGKMRIPLLCAGGLLAIAFAGLTVAQEDQWKDDLTTFTVAHELAPHNAPVAQNLANAHVLAALQMADEGRCDVAMPVFEQVAHDYPDDWYAWSGMGECFALLNNLPKAEESLRRAAEISHNPRVIQQWQELRANMGLPSSNGRE